MFFCFFVFLFFCFFGFNQNDHRARYIYFFYNNIRASPEPPGASRSFPERPGASLEPPGDLGPLAGASLGGGIYIYFFQRNMYKRLKIRIMGGGLAYIYIPPFLLPSIILVTVAFAALSFNSQNHVIRTSERRGKRVPKVVQFLVPFWS